MSTGTIVLIVILVILAAALVALYFFGKKMQKKQDTFLEGLVMDALNMEKKDRYGDMVFSIFFEAGHILRFGEGKEEAFTITDMQFEAHG